MKQLPYLEPIAKGMPIVYDESLSYYEFLSKMYNYIQDNIIPLITELEPMIQDVPQLKTDVKNLKLAMIEAQGSLSRAESQITDLQTSVNNLNNSVTELLSDVETLEAFKTSTISRLNTLEAWKVTTEAWMNNINTWKADVDVRLPAVELKALGLEDRLNTVEAGTRLLTTYNVTSTDVNIGTILAEDTEYLYWDDLVGKTLSVALIFSQGTTTNNNLPYATATGLVNGNMLLFKTEELSVVGKSIVVDFTILKDTTTNMYYIKYVPHFSTNSSRLFGGMMLTNWTGTEEIDLSLNLLGFNNPSAQIILSIR